MNVLDNLQIASILKRNGVKINGIFSKDLLPSDGIGWTVVNMQSSTDGGGTHWICYHKGSGFPLYFDSFGFPAPLEIQEKIGSKANSFGGKYIYNKSQIQDIEDSSCGYYCIACICNCRDGDQDSFEEFLSSFSKNTKENEKLLSLFFN